MKKKNKFLTKVVGTVAITAALAFPAFGLSACGNDNSSNTNNPGEHQPANPENKISVTVHYPTGLNRANEVIKVDKGDTFAKIYNQISVSGCILEGLYASGDFANKLPSETEITDSNCSVYAKLYLDLTVTSNDTNMGTVTTVGSLTEFVPGTSCTISGNTLTLSDTTITATPATGYELAGWKLNNQTLTTGSMTQGGEITAIFRKETFNVEVVENGNAANKIYTGNIEYGTTVGDFKTIIANQTGYNITQVMVGGNPVADSYVIEKGNTLAVNYTINVSLTSSNGTLSQTSMALTPSSTLVVNANVLTINGTAVTATANTGYHFVEWQVNGAMFNATTATNVTITKETTVVAVFEINKYDVVIKDNLNRDIVTVSNIEHGTTFGTLKSKIPSTYNVVAAKLADNTVVNDNTPITGETTIYITYSKNVTIGVVDSTNQTSQNGTVSTSTATINSGDTFTIAGNTLTVGNTTITVSCKSGYNLIKWLLGTTTITNGTVYDGTENTISVVVDNVQYTVIVNLTTMENETELNSIKNNLGFETLTEYVSAGTTLGQLSDNLLKYGLKIKTVKLSGSDEVINVSENNTAVSEDTVISVISCEYADLFIYDHDGISGLKDTYRNLKEVYIPAISTNNTDVISASAFGNTNIETIIFGGAVEIGSGAFSGCNIKNIYVNSLADWLNMNLSSAVFQNTNLYINNKLVTEIEIANGMTIGNYAFAGIKNIQNVIVNGDVTAIGEYAFYGCTELTTITANALGTIGASAFQGCTKLTGALTINGNIGDSAFDGCVNLTSVTLSDSITEIGEGAFWMCENITNIVLPSSLTELKNNTFRDCTGLVNVTLSSQLDSIGVSCFESCSNLESITIPQSVTNISSNAFKNSGLISAVFESPDGWIYGLATAAGFSSDNLENNATLLKKTNRTYKHS